MSRRKLYDYAGALHQRGLTTENKADRAFIIEVISDLMKRGVWTCAGDTWQERANAGRRAIIDEIDRRNGDHHAE